MVGDPARSLLKEQKLQRGCPAPWELSKEMRKALFTSFKNQSQFGQLSTSQNLRFSSSGASNCFMVCACNTLYGLRVQHAYSEIMRASEVNFHML